MSPSPAAVSAALHPVVQARCSYTSLVYQDKEAASSQTSRTQDLVRCLVEWLVVLQRLEEERKADLPPVFCRCSKAVNINQELKTVGRGLGDVSKLGERLGAEAAAPHLDSVSQDLVRLAGLLRADVSILIPSSIGRAEPSVAEQAREIVAEAESVSGLVQETVEGVTKLVYSLLGVDTCQHCSEERSQGCEKMDAQEIDPDIMNMVAAMCGDYSNLPASCADDNAKSNQEIGRQVMERSRKRKQNRPSKFTASSLPQSCKTVTSGLGSPTKKIRKVGEDGDRDSVNATEILFLLEKKKKLVKKDGLYKFVLWREALREEKNKVCLPS